VRCDTNKCALDERESPPGKLPRRAKRPSGYAIHLREKQKVKRIYGVLEKQFRNYFESASRKKGVTGEALLQLLESRLDNVVYRLGFASSRKESRQFVSHGHFLVNARKTNISSYLLRPGDKITVQDKSKEAITNKLKAERPIPGWLLLDRSTLEGSVKCLPKREEIPLDVREELIVELYSK
jgi:small subunit ribosomal protein S4